MAAKSSAEDAVEDVTFRFFPMSEDMGIDAGRRADVCMAEALRDEFEVFASFEQHRRMRVPDGVEAETVAEMVAAILVDGAHVRLLESGAVLAPADAVAAIAVELAILQPVLRLLGVVVVWGAGGHSGRGCRQACNSGYKVLHKFLFCVCCSFSRCR